MWERPWRLGIRLPAVAAVGSLALGSVLAAQIEAAPFYSLHRNAVGAWLAPRGATFPEETYDYGVREAVQAIALAARPNAIIASDAPAVVRYYLGLTRRRDVRAASLSGESLMRREETWVLVQPEYWTFENELVVAQIRARETPWRRLEAAGALAVEVFRLPAVTGATASSSPSRP